MVFPDQCPLCGTLVAEEGGLCPSCWGQTPFILGTVCDLCGTAQIGPEDGHRVICDTCATLPRPWQRGRAVFEYRGGGRRLVLALKHGDRSDLAPVLGRWMALRAAPVVTPETVLVPVPIHRRRLVGRRYNQSVLLARAMARELGVEMIPDALQRVRSTAPLDGPDHAARTAVLEAAIVANPRHRRRLENRRVCIVDDVMTTGATFAQCSMALDDARCGAVFVMALARTPQNG